MHHEHYMQRCLQLAAQGLPLAFPNPLVGSIIVYNGQIIGEGFHQEYGQAHAEVNAINSVKDKSLLPQATLYVNLEPCAHFGKTPPCSDLIIKHKIPRVVIGCTDIFSEVAGKGIQKLQQAGVDVQVDVLKAQALALNKRFFTFHKLKRPYLILKWAETSDGYVDKIRTSNSKGINWITAPSTQQLVHKWRTEESAILVGYNTWHTDRPSLTARAFAGKSPKRIIWLSQNLTQPIEPEIHADDLLFQGTLPALLDECFLKGIQSILIEGGAKTLTHFIESGYWDEARVLTGNVSFGEGLFAPQLSSSKLVNSQQLLNSDTLRIFEKA